MRGSWLSGPKTAKRKIQLRQYVTEESKRTQGHSDPFLPEDENDSPSNLNPQMKKLSFRTEHIPDLELQSTDEILSSGINLNEADRFIASLKMPSRRRRTNQARNEPYKPRVFMQLDLSPFRTASEQYEHWQVAEADDPPDEDDYDII
jgi:hypothetical protein